MSSNLVHVAHAGLSGDVIYSLPFAQYIAQSNGVRLVYHVVPDLAAPVRPDMPHPNGATLMTPQSYAFIRPVLERLPYVEDVRLTPTAQLPAEVIRLDFYRHLPMNTAAGSIPAWPMKLFGVPLELNQPWLSVAPQHAVDVVCGFSRRYRNKKIHYGFLNELDAGFIGMPDEYEHFCQVNQLHRLKHLSVGSALDAAALIAGSRFFLGNQSFAFAMAEGLKAPRALEVCELVPNVLPQGPGANEYITTSALMHILARGRILDTAFQVTTDADYTLYWA